MHLEEKEILQKGRFTMNVLHEDANIISFIKP